MATLHVRNVPKSLYESIRRLARASGSSANEEVTGLLGRALAEEQQRLGMKELLADMKRSRIRPPAGAPTAEQLIREDRGLDDLVGTWVGDPGFDGAVSEMDSVDPDLWV